MESKNKKFKLNRNFGKSNKTEIKSDGQIKCEICKKEFTKATLESHMKTHNQCEVCGKDFFTKTFLSIHKKIHEQCEFCGKMFHKLTQMLFHKRVHSRAPKRPFHKCEYCGKSFVQKVNLTSHLRIHLFNN